MIQQSVKDLAKIVEYYSYEIADLKTLLFSIDACCRGLAGSKKIFDVNDLPSQQKNNKLKITNELKNETQEQRLQRHKRFFEGLKKSFVNK